LSGTQITVEAWIYPTGFQSASPWINNIFSIDDSASNRLGLRISTYPTSGAPPVESDFYINVGGLDLSDTVGYAANVWAHLVGTYDGTTARIYKNGVQTASAAYSTAITANAGCTVAADNAFGRYFNGRICEVAIYQKALSAQQVLDHYNHGVDPAYGAIY
jgi:hypothetical protein